tara:strand:- start:998 stop:2275 length:1278 start_codon:yes stop_codon:yes gene_type:complete
MKITKQKLKQIITEELENVLNEQSSEDAFYDFYTTVRKMSPTRARVLAKTRSGGLTPAMKAQLQKAKEDKGLESVRQTADKLRKRENTFGRTNPATQSTAKALQKQLDALPDAGGSTSGEVGNLKQLASSVLNPVAGGQTSADADMTSAQPQMSMARLGDEVPGSRTASGPGGGGGATTTKARKIPAGRHDVKFQRMLNRLEKAGKLSKSDYRKISRLNVMKKDPAGAKALYKQITGEDAPESATSTARAKTKPKKPMKIGGKEVDMTDGDLDTDDKDPLTVKIPPKLKTKALRNAAFTKGNAIRKQLKGQELRDYKTATVRLMQKFRRDYPLLASEIPKTLTKLAIRTAAFELGRADGKLDVFNVIMRDRKLKLSRKRLEKIWIRAARRVEREIGTFSSKENKRRELARYARELGFSERVASSE